MGNIGYVARRQIQAVYQSGFTINPDMQFGTKVVLIASSALVHGLIAFALRVLGGTRGGNQAGIDNGAGLEKKDHAGQVGR